MLPSFIPIIENLKLAVSFDRTMFFFKTDWGTCLVKESKPIGDFFANGTLRKDRSTKI